MMTEDEARLAFEEARKQWAPEDFDMVVKLSANLGNALLQTVGTASVPAYVMLSVVGAMIEYVFSKLPDDTDRMLYLKWFTDNLHARVATMTAAPAAAEKLQ